ncbi:hypothetical protein CRG98_001467 [Punica granatum]|uniref:Reverse transcriptase Ty1/copia-type domain-containing protein n=1 Tax=Punica granatum TaxID=22663 RepID=A0A2I0LBT1_PUNGR|nr:hypothetical protein CRG98_001467 [Punica granatum]
MTAIVIIQGNKRRQNFPGHDGDVASPASRVINQSDDSMDSAQVAQANNLASQRTHSMVTRSCDGTLPAPRFVISRHPTAFSVSADLQEPRTFSKAQQDPRWRVAMEEEFQALITNHTWDLVLAPPSRNIVGCKWVYRIKQKVDGTIDRYKARLVAKGSNQREGIDYEETFSPVIKPVTIRVVLSITVSLQWPIRQLDVKNAFLHGHLSEEEFAMKDLGPVNYFLGMEAKFDKTGLHLTQAKYIHDILSRGSMLDCKPISSPVTSGARLSLHDGDPFDNPSLYRSVVGSLQYLTLTRPDIAFAVNQVCQFMHKPTTVHWSAVKRILRYLKGTITTGLHFKPGSISSLHGFSDADWAGNPDDRPLSVVSLFFLVPIRVLGVPRSSEL